MKFLIDFDGGLAGAAMDIVGADHIMWGSDCPGIFMRRSYRELIADACDSELFGEEELWLLMGGTARVAYGLA